MQANNRPPPILDPRFKSWIQTLYTQKADRSQFYFYFQLLKHNNFRSILTALIGVRRILQQDKKFFLTYTQVLQLMDLLNNFIEYKACPQIQLQSAWITAQLSSHHRGLTFPRFLILQAGLAPKMLLLAQSHQQELILPLCKFIAFFGLSYYRQDRKPIIELGAVPIIIDIILTYHDDEEIREQASYALSYLCSLVPLNDFNRIQPGLSFMCRDIVINNHRYRQKPTIYMQFLQKISENSLNNQALIDIIIDTGLIQHIIDQLDPTQSQTLISALGIITNIANMQGSQNRMSKVLRYPLIQQLEHLLVAHTLFFKVTRVRSRIATIVSDMIANCRQAIPLLLDKFIHHLLLMYPDEQLHLQQKYLRIFAQLANKNHKRTYTLFLRHKVINYYLPFLSQQIGEDSCILDYLTDILQLGQKMTSQHDNPFAKMLPKSHKQTLQALTHHQSKSISKKARKLVKMTHIFD